MADKQAKAQPDAQQVQQARAEVKAHGLSDDQVTRLEQQAAARGISLLKILPLLRKWAPRFSDPASLTLADLVELITDLMGVFAGEALPEPAHGAKQAGT